MFIRNTVNVLGIRRCILRNMCYLSNKYTKKCDKDGKLHEAADHCILGRGRHIDQYEQNGTDKNHDDQRGDDDQHEPGFRLRAGSSRPENTHIYITCMKVERTARSLSDWSVLPYVKMAIGIWIRASGERERERERGGREGESDRHRDRQGD